MEQTWFATDLFTHGSFHLDEQLWFGCCVSCVARCEHESTE